MMPTIVRSCGTGFLAAGTLTLRMGADDHNPSTAGAANLRRGWTGLDMPNLHGRIHGGGYRLFLTEGFADLDVGHVALGGPAGWNESSHAAF